MVNQKQKFLVFSLLLGMIFFFSSFNISYASSLDKVIIAQGVDASNLNPPMTAEITTDTVTMNIFDNLVVRDRETMQPVGQLATSWEMLSPTVWQFHLREGVKFHNGELFNAESVKFTIEWNLNPANNTRQRGFIGDVERVEIVDEYTVNIITKGPHPTLINRLATTAAGSMLPPKYFQEVGSEYFGQNPVGTGPYKFVEWKKDEYIKLEAFADYWHGKPEINQVLFKPVPESSSRLAMLRTGDVHIVTNLTPDQAASVRADEKIRVEPVMSGLVIYMSINSLLPGPLQDVRIRQAMNYAVDKEAIVNHVMRGFGRVEANPMAPESWGYNPNIEPYPYDPEKAKALMAEAGYDGTVIYLNAPIGRYTADHLIPQAVAQYLENVGFNVELGIHEWGTYVQTDFRAGQNSLYMLGWAGFGTYVAEATLHPLFYSGQPFSTYSNPQVDKLLDEVGQTVDQERRRELLWQVQSIIHQDAARLFLHQQASIYGVSDLVDWTPRSDEGIFVTEVSFK